MRIVLILLVMAYFSSCNPSRKANPSPSEKVLLARQVRKKALAQLKREKELYPCGVGGGMMDQIKMLALSFDYYKLVDIEQARELLVYSTTLFLNIINENMEIRPYLEHYPFNPENIEIRIYLQNSDGSEPNSGKLTIVKMMNGTLEYVIRNPETNRLTTLYEETFDVASKKLSTAISLLGAYDSN